MSSQAFLTRFTALAATRILQEGFAWIESEEGYVFWKDVMLFIMKLGGLSSEDVIPGKLGIVTSTPGDKSAALDALCYILQHYKGKNVLLDKLIEYFNSELGIE